MIVVDTVLTADNTDVLGGTDLANIPAAGGLQVFASSTQQDTTITITGPGSEPVVRTRPVTLRANAEIRENEDVGYEVPVVQGGRYVINIDVVTAATVRVRAIYFDLVDLGIA